MRYVFIVFAMVASYNIYLSLLLVFKGHWMAVLDLVVHLILLTGAWFFYHKARGEEKNK